MTRVLRYSSQTALRPDRFGFSHVASRERPTVASISGQYKIAWAFTSPVGPPRDFLCGRECICPLTPKPPGCSASPYVRNSILALTA